MSEKNMGKTTKQVTGNPERLEHGKNSHKTYIKRLKEDILKDNQFSVSSFTDNSCLLPLLLQITLNLLLILLQMTVPGNLVIPISMASMQLLC